MLNNFSFFSPRKTGGSLWLAVALCFGISHGPQLAHAADALATGVAAGAPRLLQVTSLIFAPDGKTLAAGMNLLQGQQIVKREMRLWDVTSGAVLQTVDGPANMDMGVAFAPDGKLLAGVGVVTQDNAMTGGEVGLWSVAGGKRVRSMTVAPGETVLGIAFAPDGQTLAGGSIAGQGAAGKSQVRVWDVNTGAVKRTFDGLVGNPGGLAYSRDGKWLAAPVTQVKGDKVLGSEVRLWDAANGKLQHTYAMPAVVVDALAFAPDGKTLALKATGFNAKGEAGASSIRLWDTTQGKPIWNFDEVGVNSFVQSIGFSPDGKWFVAGGVNIGHGSNDVWVWNLDPNPVTKQPYQIENIFNAGNRDGAGQNADASHLGLVTAIAPDNQTLALGYGAGGVQLIDMHMGKPGLALVNAVPAAN